MAIFRKFLRFCIRNLIYKFAFRPPRRSRISTNKAYYILEDDFFEANYKSYPMPVDINWIFQSIFNNFEHGYAYNDDFKMKIFYLFVRYDKAEFTILFSHGNAWDLGTYPEHYMELSRKLECNLVVYDYSGYGLSNGKATENNVYRSIQAVFDKLRFHYNIETRNIILMGQSIGTAPTIDLASKYDDFAGVILIAPFESLLRIVFSNSSSPYDVFPNLSKVEKVKSKVLVIHGVGDGIVPFCHGEKINDFCDNAVEPLWHSGGHNVPILQSPLLETIRKFIHYNQELKKL